MTANPPLTPAPGTENPSGAAAAPGGAGSRLDGVAAPPALPRVRIGRGEVVSATEREIAAWVLASRRAGVGGWVITVNLDILRRYHRDALFRTLADGATIWTADGAPLVWASRLQGTPLPERGNGTNIMLLLCELAAGEGRSVYLIGGNPGTAEASAHRLAERYPGLRVAGFECPPLGFDADDAAVSAIGDRVFAAEPDLVFVALGCPKQERLIAAIRDRCPSAWWLGIGVSFSFIAGEVARAPVWMQRAGLEWLHRMVQEPGRLVRRYLVDDLPFGLGLLASAATRRAVGTAGRRRGG